MSITLDMSFAEAKDFFQTAVADDNEKVRISFENEDLPLFTKMKNKLSQSFEKEKANEISDFTQFLAFGMWADREDMQDSIEYVKKLRQEQWQRSFDK